ncbi:MAG: MFS transporter [Bacillota bacterium]
MKRFNRNVEVIYWVSFLSILGYGAQRAVLSWHLKSLAIDAATVGLFISFFGLPRAVMNVAGGFFTDRFSRRSNLVVGTLLYALLGYGLLAFLESGLGIALSRALIGMGLAWATTAAMTVLSDYTDVSSRGTVFGIQKGFFWVGITFSGLIATFLYNLIGFQAEMLIFAGIGLFSAYISFKFLDKKTPKETEVKKSLVLAKDWLTVVKLSMTDAKFLTLGLVGFLAKIIEDGIVVVMLPLFFSDSALDAGLYITFFTLSFAFFQPFGGIMSDRVGRKNIILTGNLISLLGLLFLWQGFMTFASFLMGAGIGILSPAAEAFSGDLAPEGLSGSVLGYWRFERDLGSFFGPLLLPPAALFFGKEIVLILVGLTIILSLVLSIQNLPRKERLNV